MDKHKQIGETIRMIAGTDRLTMDFVPMVVDSVEEDTCVCLYDGMEIPDVRLASIPGGSENGLLITPMPGSVVQVADLSAGHLRNFLVVGYSGIESIRFHQDKTTVFGDGNKVTVEVGASTVEVEDDVIRVANGESTVEIEDGLITFNGGKNNGMVKIEELTDRINDLIKAFNNHTHTLKSSEVKITDSMGGAGQNPSPIIVPSIDSEHSTINDFSIYENEKIKH